MRRFFSLGMLLLTGCVSNALAQDNLYFHGRLIAKPCVIAPGDDLIELDFGPVFDRELYVNQRTHSKLFTINLTKCNTALATTVGVSFQGISNPFMTEKLALDITSQASGIAIGIEDEKGEIISINQDGSRRYAVQDGTTNIRFRAYVEAEPDARANSNIVRGPFSASMTFKLDYE